MPKKNNTPTPKSDDSKTRRLERDLQRARLERHLLIHALARRGPDPAAMAAPAAGNQLRDEVFEALRPIFASQGHTIQRMTLIFGTSHGGMGYDQDSFLDLLDGAILPRFGGNEFGIDDIADPKRISELITAIIENGGRP